MKPAVLFLATGLLFACETTPQPQPQPASIELTPSSTAIDHFGGSVQLTAVVKDADGAVISGFAVEWSSADAGIASVAGNGLVVGGTPGQISITATAGAATAQASVEVVLQPNPNCQPLSQPSRSAPGAMPTFGPAEPQTQLPQSTWDGKMHVILDFDGDSDPDLVRLEYSFPSSQTYSGEVNVFENDAGVLTLATSARLAAPIVPNHPRDYEVADFDADGKQDVFVAQHGYDSSPFPGAPDLLLTAPSGQLQDLASSRLQPYSQDGFSHGAASADVDCDGDADFYVASANDNEPVHLFINDGAAHFTAEDTRLPAVLASGFWQEAVFVDLDADGDPDLYLGAAAHSAVPDDLLLVNDGFGNFRRWSGIALPAPRYSPAHGVNSARSADFSGDGLPDLLLFEIPGPFSSVSAIRYWENKGGGVFEDASVASGLPAECTGEVIEPLFVADWNVDGWPDFSVPWGCSNLGGTGLFIRQSGAFTFLPMSSVVSWLSYDSPHPIDLDVDGDPDLFLPHNPEPVVVHNLTR